MFIRNQLFKINLLDNVITERILWIDSGYENCITIDINKENINAKPQCKRLKNLHQLLDDGNLELIQKDPYRLLFIEEDLSPSEVKIRDARWNSIKDLINSEPDIYLESTTSMIKRVYGNKKVSVSSIYRNLRLFWQRGNVKNSLLPDFRVCGGRGKRKILGNVKVGFREKGEEAKGINVTEEVEFYFRQGLIKCKESEVIKIKDIYNFILNEYFVEGQRYENGEFLIELKKEIPSERQFRYWYEHYSGKTRAQKNIDKIGERKHNLTSRAILGKSDTYINAPGAVYQIDSTKSDIYIVSELDPNLVIGKPTTYFVRDVFSRMIVGMYIGIKEESWVAARLAFVNTITNKVDYCKKMGITITEEKWPTHHFPSAILADNGPAYKGYKIEILSEAFGINPINAPAYRADFKGIIEKLFDMVNQKIKPSAPGSTTKYSGERGQKDPRLKARYTLKKYTQAVIRTVLFFNNSHWLTKYNPDKEIISEEVDLVPLELWNWGIKRRSGLLRFFEEDFVKLTLMDRFKGAKVEKYGIHVMGDLYYECQKAHDEGWFSDAALKGSWEVELAYDPASTDQVYIINKDGGCEICTLLPHCRQYGGMSFADYSEIRSKRKKTEREYLEKKEREAEINLENNLGAIRDSAEEIYQNNKINQTKSSKLSGIRNNRQEERKTNDYKEALVIGNSPNESLQGAKDIYIGEEPEEPFEEDFDFLEQFQKENLINE